MKLLRLRGRKTNQRVLDKGTLWRGRTMNIRWMPGVPPSMRQRLRERSPARANVRSDGPRGLYVGTFAPLKLSKRAVDRNRMRRRCREALRIVVQEERELPTVQLLLSPRSSSLSCDFRAILTDVRAFLASLSPCLKPHANEAPSLSSR
jgi:ribonuclease P protein component